MTIIPFTPNASQAFSFIATFDGASYSCTVRWSLWAQRWYLGIYPINQTDPVVFRALIASPQGYPINLLFGYFLASTMYFDDASQSFVVTP